MKGTAVCEWLEADGRGGFASGSSDGMRTRRYHALLLAATRPPSGRVVLVNTVEAWLETDSGAVALTSHRYALGVIYPPDVVARSTFAAKPWPTWLIALPAGGVVSLEILVAPGRGQTSLRWSVNGHHGPARLCVRLLMSGRDYHALHRENDSFGFAPIEQVPGVVTWQTYPGLPPLAAHGGDYAHDPLWYRSFLYAAEAERGLDCMEDLASPGVLRWDLSAGVATLALRADGQAAASFDELAWIERDRRGKLPPLQRAARDFLAERRAGLTVIAGFPWFTDWGRDTFVALRGLLIATGRHDDALKVLLEWAGVVDRGMLPNRFPDGEGPPEYNAVDASLWFIVAVHDMLRATDVAASDAAALRGAALAILAGYAAGTRYGIRCDTDGLLAAGVPGVQLTWMDAKVGDWVVTSRIGKPVEVQALWINALAIAAGWPGGERWTAVEMQARRSFLQIFPNEESGGLVDVADTDGVAGRRDKRIRPNQVLAAGGLPFACVPPALARSILDLVEARLLTPVGLHSLDPSDLEYRGRYEGGVLERDGAYHQGTVWPWLLDPFIDAWLRVRGGTLEARAEGFRRFLPPLRRHLAEAGFGSVSEIFDGDSPHEPRGCPFQAWSVGALLRIEAMLGVEG